MNPKDYFLNIDVPIQKIEDELLISKDINLYTI